LGVFLVSEAICQTNLPAPKQERLLNGLKILMWSDAKAEKVLLKLRVHSGSAFDPQDREGLMQMLADSLFPNAAAREFFKDDLGGDLEVITNYDYIQINASSKPENFVKMLETIGSAVANPVIDKDTTATIRSELLTKVLSLEADPAYLADRAVAKRLFGTFPYGRSRLGTTDSIKRIDPPNLLEAEHRFLTADNATIAITGNFDKAVALRAVKRYFGGWEKADKKVPATFRQPDEPDTEELKIEIPQISKTYSRWARFAPARNDQDYYPMTLFGWIRAGQRCPDSADYQANLLRGSYTNRSDVTLVDRTGYSGPCPLPLLWEVRSGAIEKTITQQDFVQAKAKLIDSIRNLLSTPSGLADLWLDVDTYKLISADDEIRKVTAVSYYDVVRHAKAFADSPAVKVVVLPPAKPAVP